MQDSIQTLSSEITEPLRRSRPWMKFIAIMGFIGFGLLVLDALFVFLGAGMPPHTQATRGLSSGILLLVAIVYIVLGFFVYFMPPFLLMKTATALNGIEQNSSLAALAEAAERQRRF